MRIGYSIHTLHETTKLNFQFLNIYTNSECIALYSALQVYIHHYIQHPNVELIFGPPGLYSALYSNSECRAQYSALQDYIQHFIQHPNVELCIWSSKSIFNTIFKLRMSSSTCGSTSLYPALYSTSECRDLYSILQDYNQHYIQTPNVELYMRLFSSIFSTILNIRI